MADYEIRPFSPRQCQTAQSIEQPVVMGHDHAMIAKRCLRPKRLGDAVCIRPRGRLDQRREQRPLRDHGVFDELGHSPEGGAAVHLLLQSGVLSS